MRTDRVHWPPGLLGPPGRGDPPRLFGPPAVCVVGPPGRNGSQSVRVAGPPAFYVAKPPGSLSPPGRGSPPGRSSPPGNLGPPGQLGPPGNHGLLASRVASLLAVRVASRLSSETSQRVFYTLAIFLFYLSESRWSPFDSPHNFCRKKAEPFSAKRGNT